MVIEQCADFGDHKGEQPIWFLGGHPDLCPLPCPQPQGLRHTHSAEGLSAAPKGAAVRPRPSLSESASDYHRVGDRNTCGA